jgi:THO complex subunit 2
MSWHADPAVFETECSQHPGFLTVFRNAPSATTPSSANNNTNNNNNMNNNNKQEQLDYENFRHVCHKWHYKLTKSFVMCLKSEEYLQMRNSLIILTKIASHYPKLTGFCTALEKQVEKIKQVEKDKRQDIFTLASAYLGQLKMRRAQMMDEGKFHFKEATNLPSSTTTATSSTASSAKGATGSSAGKSVGAVADSSVKAAAASGKLLSSSAVSVVAAASAASLASAINGASSSSASPRSTSGLSNTTTASSSSSQQQQQQAPSTNGIVTTIANGSGHKSR